MHSFTNSCLLLRQGKAVEKQCREIKIDAADEPLADRTSFRMEMSIKKLFPHRWGDRITQKRRQRRQDHWRVEMTLMICRENYRRFQRVQPVRAVNANLGT